MEFLLKQFYKLHNPAKIPDIPMILEAYRGAEAILFDQLTQKYGEPGPAAMRDWVVVSPVDNNIPGRKEDEQADDKPGHHDSAQRAGALHPAGQDRGGQTDAGKTPKLKQA